MGKTQHIRTRLLQSVWMTGAEQALLWGDGIQQVVWTTSANVVWKHWGKKTKKKTTTNQVS